MNMGKAAIRGNANYVEAQENRARVRGALENIPDVNEVVSVTEVRVIGRSEQKEQKSVGNDNGQSVGFSANDFCNATDEDIIDVGFLLSLVHLEDENAFDRAYELKEKPFYYRWHTSVLEQETVLLCGGLV